MGNWQSYVERNFKHIGCVKMMIVDLTVAWEKVIGLALKGSALKRRYMPCIHTILQSKTFNSCSSYLRWLLNFFQ